jgi:hypothetical protein
MSGLHLYHAKPLARLFNPTRTARALGKSYQGTDVWGQPESTLTEVRPGQIVTVDTGLGRDRTTEPPASAHPSGEPGVELIAGPTWRVGENQGQPDPRLIEQLETQIAELEAQLFEIEAQLSEGGVQHLLQHRYYILKREEYEARLSAQLNRHKLTSKGHKYLYTPAPEIAELGAQLNQLRIKRRIYDYVVEAL